MTARPVNRQQLVGIIDARDWYETARAVYRRARLGAVVSWVDDDGGVWTCGASRKQIMPPAEQVLGLYGTDIALQEIEEDVLHHLQQLSKAKTP
jgi:DNA-directed RNA polymerase subunit K/omega